MENLLYGPPSTKLNNTEVREELKHGLGVHN